MEVWHCDSSYSQEINLNDLQCCSSDPWISSNDRICDKKYAATIKAQRSTILITIFICLYKESVLLYEWWNIKDFLKMYLH
jgi:hypothetical protein